MPSSSITAICPISCVAPATAVNSWCLDRNSITLRKSRDRCSSSLTRSRWVPQNEC